MPATRNEEILSMSDQHRIFVRSWTPEISPPKSVVVILHGLAEHGARYNLFASNLNANGTAVFAPDHRGHGKTAPFGIKGYFAEKDGWDRVTQDAIAVINRARALIPNVPVFIFGHSMGSFITLSVLQNENCPSVAGAILTGSNYAAPITYRAGQLVTKLEALRQGATGRSKLVDFLSFGSFNRHFAPNRTNFDWLSSTESEVDKYVNDPDCGYLCTNQMWLDMLDGLSRQSTTAAMKKIDANTPILLMCGEKDPVGGPKGIQRLSEKLQSAGVKKVKTRTFNGGRHEIINEALLHDSIVTEVSQWISANSVTNSSTDKKISS